LPADVEVIVGRVLQARYLTRQRPSVAAVCREITRLCRVRGLPVPSVARCCGAGYQVGRAYMTIAIAIDVACRCVVGLVVTLEAPSATSAGLCLARRGTDKSAWAGAVGR
jgi:putative transposase